MSPDSHTKVYAIIGNPVRHSFSPKMHNAAFRELGLNSVYTAFEVTNVEDAMKGVRALGISGLSVTIPHKEAVIPYLDDIDPIAEKIGAVNTILNNNGQLTGYNTDGAGAYRSIVDSGLDLNGKAIGIIGNGGTAKAVLYTLLDRVEIAHAHILGRDLDKVTSFIDKVKKELPKPKTTDLVPYSYESATDDDLFLLPGNIDLIINTTPVGMFPDDQRTPLPNYQFSADQTVFDAVYKPLETRLLQEAKRSNAKVIDGLSMLVNQGVLQFELWTGEKAPVRLMDSIVRDIFK
ncbi:MAG: shikimate dehydrogenase [Spirochaetota bacterium]|nr:shikimate dehydrogenase [Spirochaetota bacterium]